MDIQAQTRIAARIDGGYAFILNLFCLCCNSKADCVSAGIIHPQYSLILKLILCYGCS